MPKVESVFFLRTGKVKMFAISDEGEQTTIHIFQPGSYFPLMLALSSFPNHYFFETTEASELVSVPTSKVIHFLQAEPEVLFDVVTRFSDALCGLMLRIETLSFETAQQKLIKILLYLLDKFGVQTEEGTEISLPLSQVDIADWIGVQRETVTRNLSKLQEQKILQSKNKHIIVLDVARLQSLQKNAK